MRSLWPAHPRRLRGDFEVAATVGGNIAHPWWQQILDTLTVRVRKAHHVRYAYYQGFAARVAADHHIPRSDRNGGDKDQRPD